MGEHEDAPRVGDASETLELIFGPALAHAWETVQFADEHGVFDVARELRLPAQGFEWSIMARYGAGDPFVRITAETRTRPLDGEGEVPVMAVSSVEFARLLGNQGASWQAVVPRQWVELAVRARGVPVGVVVEVHEDGKARIDLGGRLDAPPEPGES